MVDAIDQRRIIVVIEVNQLSVEFSISPTKIKQGSDLLAKVVFKNISKQTLRLNALFLDMPHILLKVRNAEGKLVNPSSPGFPPDDDGEVGRVNLQPNESISFIYRGSDYFGVPLSPGIYKMRFRYENQPSQYSEWVGLIETEWLDFEVCR